jgi:hypothetical protein
MLVQYLKTMTFFFKTLSQILIIIIFLFLYNSGLKILFTYYLFKEVPLILTGSIITEFIYFFIESDTDSDSNSDIESDTESDHSYSDTDIECQKIAETRRLLEAERVAEEERIAEEELIAEDERLPKKRKRDV